MLPNVALAFLLPSFEAVAGHALFDRRPAQANTTSGLNRRQGTVLITRFSTIFFTGDGSKIRTADAGFDCRVDLLHDLWGFCPNSVSAATDCGLAGSCVDSFSCSKGCGFTGASLTTFTCSESRAPFCSTALLTLSNNVGPFTYLACGRGPSTDEYMAFTTSESKPTSPSAGRTVSLSTSTSTSTRETASTTPTSSSHDSQPSPPTNAAAASTSRPTESQLAGNDNNTNKDPGATNTGAIIGCVVGSLALICGCVVVTVWLLRRHRSAASPDNDRARGADGSYSDLAHRSTEPPRLLPPVAQGHKSEGVAELPARGPGSSNWLGYSPMTPVELPGSSGVR